MQWILYSSRPMHVIITANGAHYCVNEAVIKLLIKAGCSDVTTLCPMKSGRGVGLAKSNLPGALIPPIGTIHIPYSWDSSERATPHSPPLSLSNLSLTLSFPFSSFCPFSSHCHIYGIWRWEELCKLPHLVLGQIEPSRN